MEDKLISSQWLINDLLNKSFYPAIVKSSIESAPAVDAAPVRHGHWEVANDGTHFCSNCGCDATYTWDDIERNYIYSADDVPDRITNYCPNCGAKMTRRGGF